MSITASPELISLCQSQLLQLTKAFGPISAVIYLAETSVQADQPAFVPVASYPESFDAWSFQWSASYGQVDQVRPPGPSPALPPMDVTNGNPETSRISTELKSEPLSQNPNGRIDVDLASETTSKTTSTRQSIENRNLLGSNADPNFNLEIDLNQEDDKGFEMDSPEQQIVLPLLYTEVVVGLLVIMRYDRSWREEEHRYLQGVAQGIAAGCGLERRNQWLKQRLQTKRALQSRQSEVFHNLMHQFRNPLTALGTFGKLLLRRMKAEDANRAIADNMLRESRRLQELINDFDETVELGDADLQTDGDWLDNLTGPGRMLPGHQPPASLPGTVDSSDKANDEAIAATAIQLPAKGLGRQLQPRAESLNDLLSPLWVVTEARAAERQIKTWSQIPREKNTQVRVDRAASQEVLANLLDNAVKYSSAGAWVWLLTGARRMQDGMAYQGILIGDTGAGIPAIDQPNLFQRHYRGVQAQGPIEGTGLGLAIASDLVQQMQGYIDVISPVHDTDWIPDFIQDQLTTADGPGTTFIVWLPEA